MVKILYEDSEILVAVKPAGLESQSSRKMEPDMVSEIKNHLRREQRRAARAGAADLSTISSTETGEPYVGVVHRLDKPVAGVMVYGKTRSAAAALSKQVQERKMTKIYHAVICGKPVETVGNYVDNLWRDGKSNRSFPVDKSHPEGKRAELRYRVLDICQEEQLALVEIELLTGRHHQIRVQFASRGLPLWGDGKYNPAFSQLSETAGGRRLQGRKPLALAAVRLAFYHPMTGERMEFSHRPSGGAFRLWDWQAD